MRRPRLVELGAAARLTVVEAPSGAGKTTLLAEVVAAHDGPVVEVTFSGRSATRGQLLSRVQRSLRLRGLAELAAATVRPDDLLGTVLPWADEQGERLLLRIDDVHLADDDLDGLLAELCDRWPAPHRLVLAGRRLPTAARGCLVGTDSVLLGAEDLRLRPEEARAVLGGALVEALGDAEVARITDGCDGWPAAVALAGARLRRAARRGDDRLRREALELAHRPSTVRDLLGRLLEATTARDREAVAQLALLPALDDHLVDAAGIDGGVAGVVDLGLPLDERSQGVWVLPDVVRDALAADGWDPRLARVAARHLVEIALPEDAIEVLVAARLEEDLAELLVDLPPGQLGQLDAVAHAAAVAALPHASLVTRPRILVHLADSYAAAGHTEATAESVARAVDLVASRPDGDGSDPQVLEVRAADLTARAVAHDDGLVAEAEQLLARADLPPMARGRLLAAVGRATASRRTAASLRVAARRLDEAASVFDREGATAHALAVRVVAATDASIPLGRYEVALEQLDRALANGPGDVDVRVEVLPSRAFALVALGRYAEAEAVLDELRRTASTAGALGNQRSAALARWAAARAASQRGDGETTWAACRAVERSDVVVDTGGGAFFRADAAQLLARVGWVEDAERLLADARERDDGRTDLVTVAEFVVAAHLGDLGRADAALGRLDGGGSVEPRDRWRITLLHAAVCHRSGDPRGPALAAAAFEEAAQLGHPRLPLVQEPVAARELLALAGAGSASARDVARTDGARIRLLGGFDIEDRGGRTEPAGRPGQLIAFLALHERRATVDQAIDALWPDGEPGRGRERLRTVLRRVRRAHGDLIERHDELLRLRPEVTLDLEEFLGFCRQAQDPATASSADATPDVEGSAAAALALHRGEPVPSLGHLAWVAACRRQVEERALGMHDIVARASAREGRFQDAVRSMLVALTLEPLAEHRYLAAARFLLEQGRRGRALRLLTEGRAVLTEAALEPSRAFSRLEDHLQRA